MDLAREEWNPDGDWDCISQLSPQECDASGARWSDVIIEHSRSRPRSPVLGEKQAAGLGKDVLLRVPSQTQGLELWSLHWSAEVTTGWEPSTPRMARWQPEVDAVKPRENHHKNHGKWKWCAHRKWLPLLLTADGANHLCGLSAMDSYRGRGST